MWPYHICDTAIKRGFETTKMKLLDSASAVLNLHICSISGKISSYNFRYKQPTWYTKKMSPTLFTIFAWILTITTLFGNCFIIIIIVSRKPLSSSKLNWFIISLAVADFLVGLSLYPHLFFCERWFSRHTNLMKSFRWIFIYSSVCYLCAMTVDRYLAITSPIYHRTKVSERVVVVWITLSWLVVVVFAECCFHSSLLRS